ncbi:MAG: hypothetical protein K2N87_04090 [Eubacterium sp.]|nr:hypothetical protein [Eubacterium sp.]
MKKRFLILISIFFILLIFIQHHFVMMYFDDYGYASLSYGWTKNEAGMSYQLPDIAKFLVWHYFNWGGRILYYFFETVVFRIGGAGLMQVTQALLVAMIGIVSGKMVAVSAKCDSYVGIAFVFVLYGTMHIQTLRDGVYWYSASVGYVWPLLPLLGSMYLLLRIQGKETVFRKCAAVFLMFFAAFSQEQMAVLAVIWILGIAFFQYFFGKRNKHDKRYIPQYMVFMGAGAIFGSMLTVLAPGNFVRAQDERYVDFYSKSLTERMAKNTGIILDINIGMYNWVFVVILTVFCGTAVALYFKNRSTYVAIFLFTGYFLIEQIYSVPYIFGIFVRIVWAISLIVLLSVYYYKQKNYLFLSMLAAGIASQGMMVLSPSISMRCHTMMEFLLHLVVAECMASTMRMLKNKKVQVFCYCVPVTITAAYAVVNFCTIIYGYKNNYAISQMNHYKLLETKNRCNAGKAEQEVLLYKLMDDTYANCMPYHPGFDFIEVWMKKYYELPDEIVFYWMDLGGDSDLRFISGSWYQDHWLGEGAVFAVQAEEDRILEVTVTNPQEVENQRIQYTFAGEDKVYDLSAGETKTIELHVPAGRHELTITPSRTFVPDNGDIRELSVVLSLDWK